MVKRVWVLISCALILAGVLAVASGLGMWGQKLSSFPASSIYLQGEQKFQPEPQTSTQSGVEGVTGEMARAVRVLDGDTIEVQIGEGVSKLRYIGVDTPETVDPKRPVGCFGHEASNENKRLVEGKELILQKDISETDKFGRLLRFVYLKETDGKTVFINDYLVRFGFARAIDYPPDVKYSEQFHRAEKEARDEGRGLWGKCVT